MSQKSICNFLRIPAHIWTQKDWKYWDSADLGQGKSYECRHLANQYEWLSINQFLYLPIVTSPENDPCIQMVIRIAAKI